MDETTGQRLKRMRKATHLNQAQLARRAGIKQQAVSMIERDERTDLHLETLRGLAAALGMPVDSFVRKLVGDPDLPLPKGLLALLEDSKSAATATPEQLQKLARAQADLGVELGQSDFLLLLRRLRGEPPA